MAIDAAHVSSNRARLGWWWFGLTAAAIAVFAPLPYLANSLRALSDGGSVLAANYVNRATVVQAAFYAHIACGGVALLLSPVQFVARLRAVAPRVHRLCGRVVVASICLAGSAGVVLSTINVAGPVGTAGFGALAVLWVGFAVTAVRAIRRRDIQAHRRWVIRTFALTYAAVTLRLWLGLLIAAQVGVGGVDADVAFRRAYLVVPFLAWVPNLLVAERYLRRVVPARVPLTPELSPADGRAGG